MELRLNHMLDNNNNTRTKRLNLAFEFEHKKRGKVPKEGETQKPETPLHIEGQIGCQLLGLAQREFFGKRLKEMVTTYMVDVRGYHFGFWKAEFTFETIQSLVQGLQPLQETVFAVSRHYSENFSRSGWNFNIPEERELIIYALQTFIDYFVIQNKS